MKKALFNMMMVAFLLVGALGINTGKAQGSVSLQVFYDELQPYGNWMQYGNYGYVWTPNVDRDFTPYGTNGYWVNTEYGNTWVSDYAWGWAPFHYGRWLYDDFYGWLWIPGTEWAPAWVAWRSGGGYYGWAPLMPGINISVSFNYYNNIPNRYWNFVPCRYITYHTVHHHCVPRPQVINIINNTTIVTHNHYDNRRQRTYFTGPSRSDIEHTNHERVEVYNVSDRNRPGRSEVDRGTISFYKPEIDNAHDGRTRPVPTRVVREERSGNEDNRISQSLDERPSESRNNQPALAESFHRTERVEGSRNTTEQERTQTNWNEQRRTFNPSERTQQQDRENQNRSFEHERMNQDQQHFNQQERSKQIERQRDNHQTQREYSNPNSQQRTYEPLQNHSVERQPATLQSFSRERSVVSPSNHQNSRSQPQREQFNRGSSDHQSSQSSHSSGGSRTNSSRKRD